MKIFYRTIIFIAYLLLLSPAVWADASVAEKEGKRDAIEVFYQEGIRLYKEGKYLDARSKFLKVQKYRPEYEATEAFLRRIAENLEYQQVKEQQQRQTILEQQQDTLTEAQKREEEIQKKLSRLQQSEEKWKKEYERLEVEKRLRAERQVAEQKEKILAERRQQEKLVALQFSLEQKRVEREKQAALKKEQERARLERLQSQRAEQNRQVEEKVAQASYLKEQLRLEREKTIALKKSLGQDLRDKRQQEKEKQVALKKKQEQERLQKVRQRQQEEKQRQELARNAQKKAVAQKKTVARSPAAVVPVARTVSAAVEPAQQIAPSPAKTIAVPRSQKVSAASAVHPPAVKSPSAAALKNRRDLTRKAQDLYHVITASYKAGQYVHALDKTTELRTVLSEQDMDKSFEQEMTAKINKLETRYKIAKEEALHQKRKLELPNNSRLIDIYQRGEDDGEEYSDVEDPIEANEPAPSAPRKDVPSDSGETVQLPVSVPAGKSAEVAPENSQTSMVQFPKEQPQQIAQEEELPPTVSEENRLERELAQRIDALYRDGLEFYRKDAYDMAKKILVQVDKLSPGYKLTKTYLNMIERDLATAKMRADATQGTKTSLPAGKMDAISQTLNEYDQ